jgi:hypothetical protein
MTSILEVRKLADTSVGERVARYDPVTGAKYLADPDTWDVNDRSTWVASPYPLLGVRVEGDAPKECKLPTSWVIKGQAEGYVELDNPRMVFRPGGPKEEPWRVTHTFTHADSITLHTIDGDVVYRVVEQPDKWPAEKNDLDEGFGGEVRWFYLVKLVKEA